MFLSLLIINEQGLSKIKWFSLMGVVFVFGAIGLFYAYPDQAEFIFNPQSIFGI